MKPIGDANLAFQAAAQNAAWRACALQKPRKAADLRGEFHDQPHEMPFRRRKDGAAAMAQSGTDEPMPFRHAPRLTAAFTAQLLGQILPNPERASLPTYRREPLNLPLGFDQLL